MTASKPALLAVRDRREEVIQALSDRFANDVIDLDEFEARLERAHGATTVAALDALVADLGPLPEAAQVVHLAELVVAGRAEPPRTVSAVFSSIERRGSWQVPGAIRARSVFGSTVLDFREARFTAAVTELRVAAVFGNLEIVVPPNLAVECEGSAVFGNFEGGGSAVADPDRPILRITGRAVFGNIEVRTQLPGESAWDAHRRRCRDEKALTPAERPLLPPGRR